MVVGPALTSCLRSSFIASFRRRRLGLTGEADDAALTVDADDLGFRLLAFPSGHCAASSTRSRLISGSLQDTFDVVAQVDDSALVSTSFTVPRTMLPFSCRDVVGERIVFQLLDAQGDALALQVDRQDDGFQLVALLEATYGFFADFVPGDVGQVDQAVDAAVEPMKIPKSVIDLMVPEIRSPLLNWLEKSSHG